MGVNRRTIGPEKLRASPVSLVSGRLSAFEESSSYSDSMWTVMSFEIARVFIFPPPLAGNLHEDLTL